MCAASSVPDWPLYARDFPAPFTGAFCIYTHRIGAPNALGTVVPTASEIAAWVDQYAANHPLSLESHTQVAGQDVSSTPADQVVTQAVPASDVATEVKPATEVGPTDVVVNKNATAPAGPTPTPPATQNTSNTSTTTTTTVTNPDGTTTATSTTTQTEQAPAGSCNTGNHEQRTFGGILQSHIDAWKGSGLLSALNLLGTLVWPTSSPTYTLQSTFLGNISFDFSSWSGMLLAIRSVIIAIAGFVAYKIIFVGSRA